MLDRRDPQKLGEALLGQAPLVRQAYGDDIPLSEIYDNHVCHFGIPPYDGSETIATFTKARYRAEKEAEGIDVDALLSQGPLDTPID